MHPAPDLKRFTVITGHYGSGKTNLAVNLALDLTETYDEVTIVDLDIVNPYFRSSDYAEMLGKHGIEVIAPIFAGTTLDAPSLSPAIYSVFEKPGMVILDVGGDDAGATALGRFEDDIREIDYDLLYVVNRYRTLTSTPREAADLLGEIELASHLSASAIVNNSHLRDQTTLSTVLESMDYARATAELLGLPLCFTTVPARLAGKLSDEPGDANHIERAYLVETHVRTPWEEAPADEEV